MIRCTCTATLGKHLDGCSVLVEAAKLETAQLIHAHAGRGEGIPPMTHQQALRVVELITGSGALHRWADQDAAARGR